MDRRPIAETRVAESPKHPNEAVRTVVPVPAAKVLGLQGIMYLSYLKRARYHDVTASRSGRGTRVSESNRWQMRMPRRVIDEMGAVHGDVITWYVACGPGGPVSVQIGRKSGRSATRPRRPKRNAKTSTKYLATTNVFKFSSGGSPHVQSNIPKQVLMLLGAADAGHIRWEDHRAYYVLEPCRRDADDARRITRTVNQKGYKSCVAYLPVQVARRLYAGRGTTIDWHAAADGTGGWEIRVRPGTVHGRPGRTRPDGSRK